MEACSLVPEWIKRQKAENDQRQAATEAQAQRELAATFSIQAGAQLFWKQFLKELKNNTDNLELIALRGSLSVWQNNHAFGEESCRVTVARKSVIPHTVNTDIHFNNGGLGLRCSPFEGRPFELSFCLDPRGNVAVLADTEYSAMDAERAAQFIVERMAKMVRD